MRNIGHIPSYASAFIACAALSSPVLAQQAQAPSITSQAPPATSPQDQNTGVGDIVVTAQRRSERLLSAPLSVSVVDAARAKDSGAVSTRNLGEIASGLTSTTNGLAFQPAVRGITTTGTSAGDESNIAIYVDGVYMAAQAGNFFNLKDVERIEVLKGPQGTLFGRNATGGAIRILTKDPSLTAGHVDVEANYGTQLRSIDIGGTASTPITPTLAASISANYYNDDGYIHDIIPGWDHGKLGKTKNHMVRGKLLWKPTDNFKILASMDEEKSISDTQFDLAPIDGLNAYRNTPGVIIPTKPYQFAGNLIPYFWNHGLGGSLTATLDLDKFTITSITARRRMRSYGQLDGDRTNLPVSAATTSNNFDWLTQEVTVNSHFEGPFNFVTGLYYFHANSSIPHSEAYLNSTLDSTGFTTDLGTLASATTGKVKSDSIAGFGEATWNITPKLSVIGGVRFTTERKDLLTTPIKPVLPVLTDSKRWSNWNYRVTAQYKFSDSTNIYLTNSTGFKAGEYQATSATFVQRVDPEKIKSWELGLKSKITSWLSGTVAGYYYKYDNIQVQSNNFINGNNIIILANAAKATVAGVDADLYARLAKGLTVQVGVSYLPKAQYDKYTNALDSVPKGFPGSLNPSLCPSSPQCGLGNDQIIRTLTDSRMIRAPKFSGNIGATYETAIGDGKLRVTGNLFFTSRFFWVAGEHIAQPAYTLVNARAAYTLPGGRVTLSVFGRNLTDKVYSIYTSPNAVGVSSAYAAPREVGFGAGFAF